jgi:hypothetical protein
MVSDSLMRFARESFPARDSPSARWLIRAGVAGWPKNDGWHAQPFRPATCPRIGVPGDDSRRVRHITRKAETTDVASERECSTTTRRQTGRGLLLCDYRDSVSRDRFFGRKGCSHEESVNAARLLAANRLSVCSARESILIRIEARPAGPRARPGALASTRPPRLSMSTPEPRRPRY